MVLPAYAGMIPINIEPDVIAQGAPRVCGDDPPGNISVGVSRGCSPRMRG